MEISQILNPADLNPKRFTTADKYFAKRLDFKDIKFQVKVTDTKKKKKKKRIPLALAFLIMKIRSNTQHTTSMYQKKTWKKHVHLSLTGEDGKRHYVLIIDFKRFMYDPTLHCGRKHVIVIVYKISLQKIALKLMAIKGLRCLKKVYIINSNILNEQ